MEQVDVLMVGDQPYSSGSNSEVDLDDNNYKRETNENKEKNEKTDEEKLKEEKERKISEPIFVPVISGTATIDTAPPIPEKIVISNVENDDDKSDDESEEPEVKERAAAPSKCCILL